LFTVTPAQADNLPFPEPTNENAYAVPVEHLRLRVWAQYRVMYNASNIPSGINNGSLPTAGTGTGKLNYGDTTGYDFFRQRMRLALDLQHKDSSNVGAYMQMEYRGGFGGSSPAASDPRGESGANAGGTPNAFNRLQARGIRYGMSTSPRSKITPWWSAFFRPSTRSAGSCGMVSGTFSSAAHRWAGRRGTATTASAFTGLPQT
jgi:hypothetical protein